VAENQGRIIGHMVVRVNILRPPLFVHGKEAFIEEIFIVESYRRKGIGSLLLQETEEWAKKKGIFSIGLFVSTKNKTAFSAYKKSGFFEHHMKMSKIV
jgi:GNAT superfamily N-acetyltransferase